MKTKAVGLCLLGAAMSLVGTGAVVASQKEKAAAAAPSQPLAAGQVAYVDEQGNRIAPPEEAAQATPKAAIALPTAKENTAVEGGGKLLDLSSYRVYSTAHIENGKVHMNCESGYESAAGTKE